MAGSGLRSLYHSAIAVTTRSLTLAAIRWHVPCRDSRNGDTGGLMADFDLAIIGGGINGAGIARDAAGRGLRVLLVEQNDLASGTSSASTKLIHGGLRYLETTRSGWCARRWPSARCCCGIAPHIIRPLRFVLPHHAGAAPGAGCCGSGCSSTTISAAARSCPATETVDLTPPRGRRAAEAAHSRAASSIPTAGSTMRASWCSTRSTPPSAAPTIRTRTRLRRAPSARGDDWQLRAQRAAASREVVTARALVNAAGPWVGAGRRTTVLRLQAVRRMCAWSRAATSWCRGCSSTTTPTSSRTPTAASCSRSRTKATSR